MCSLPRDWNHLSRYNVVWESNKVLGLVCCQACDSQHDLVGCLDGLNNHDIELFEIFKKTPDGGFILVEDLASESLLGLM